MHRRDRFGVEPPNHLGELARGLRSTARARIATRFATVPKICRAAVALEKRLLRRVESREVLLDRRHDAPLLGERRNGSESQPGLREIAAVVPAGVESLSARTCGALTTTAASANRRSLTGRSTDTQLSRRDRPVEHRVTLHARPRRSGMRAIDDVAGSQDVRSTSSAPRRLTVTACPDHFPTSAVVQTHNAVGRGLVVSGRPADGRSCPTSPSVAHAQPRGSSLTPRAPALARRAAASRSSPNSSYGLAEAAALANGGYAKSSRGDRRARRRGGRGCARARRAARR